MEDPANSKRRRGLGVVTANACTECRKKRAKCDGQTPCGRCASQTTECVYETPVRQSKGNMRQELEQLRTNQRHNDRILAALVSDDDSAQVLEQLREGETPETINARLEGESSASPRPETSVTTFARLTDQQAIGNALGPAMGIKSWSLSGNTTAETRFNTQPGNVYEAAWPTWDHEMTSETQEPIQDQSSDAMGWQSDAQVEPQQVGHLQPLIGSLNHHYGLTNAVDSVTQESRHLGQGTIIGHAAHVEPPSTNVSATWTTVTMDLPFVRHLMTLYFCWEYPTFASLSKEHFLDAFANKNPIHCSSLLVNALLALGCRFSNQPQSRADPNDNTTTGDHYFAEALRLLNEETDRHSLTTVQALGLMSIREANCGRSSEGLFLSGQSIRLAIEMGLQIEISHGETAEASVDQSVRSATFWGAFALDQAWSLSIGRLPFFSRDLKLLAKPTIIDHIEASDWIPYTDDGIPMGKSCSQPSNVRSVYKTFCELSEIVHNSLYKLYSPGTYVTSKSLIAAYTDYLRWYDGIPVSLRLGQNFTPAVLFVHMYYHYAILLLFRPFMKLDIIGSSVTPRDICAQAADALSALVSSYSKLYTLRRTPSFVPYFVLTSSIAHVITLGNSRSGPEKVRQGFADLKDMTVCHGFAIRACNILRFLVLRWNVSFKLEEGEGETLAMEDLCRPRAGSVNQFSPKLENHDILNGIGPVQLNENPLFWPFPFQGRPMLDTGNKLEETGFRISQD